MEESQKPDILKAALKYEFKNKKRKKLKKIFFSFFYFYLNISKPLAKYQSPETLP